ncbi:galactokinase [Marmoricola sp. URHA0025 HA25]
MDHVTASAPGRVNLIGEHLDYNGGRCLPIAIPQRTTATVGPADEGVTVRSGDLAWTGAVGERPAGWAAYVVGVLDVLGVRASLQIDISSDVPVGAGLSSSAALECSVAVGVDALLGLGLTRDDITAACIRAETEYVGAPTGGLDQTASMHAEAGQAVLLDFADGSRALVGFDPASAGLSLLVVDTRVAHEHVDGGYTARRADCEQAARTLGVRFLTDVRDPVSALTTLTDERLRRRAAHVFSEQQRVGEFVRALDLGDWAEAGALMTSSHESLRDDFEVSCAELDTVVDVSLGAGAIGARMTGGGFGGSAIVLLDTALVDPAREAIDRAFSARGWGAPAHLEAPPSDGARVDAPPAQ